MAKQVFNLANFNYAREPEFVRNRLKLRDLSREVSNLIIKINSKHIEPILERLGSVQTDLANDARKYEESSESMAQDFLAGKKNYTEFIEEYIRLRNETSRKRILADRLAKERDSLTSIYLHINNSDNTRKEVELGTGHNGGTKEAK